MRLLFLVCVLALSRRRWRRWCGGLHDGLGGDPVTGDLVTGDHRGGGCAAGCGGGGVAVPWRLLPSLFLLVPPVTYEKILSTNCQGCHVFYHFPDPMCDFGRTIIVNFGIPGCIKVLQKW